MSTFHPFHCRSACVPTVTTFPGAGVCRMEEPASTWQAGFAPHSSPPLLAGPREAPSFPDLSPGVSSARGGQRLSAGTLERTVGVCASVCECTWGERVKSQLPEQMWLGTPGRVLGALERRRGGGRQPAGEGVRESRRWGGEGRGGRGAEGWPAGLARHRTLTQTTSTPIWWHLCAIRAGRRVCPDRQARGGGWEGGPQSPYSWNPGGLQQV